MVIRYNRFMFQSSLISVVFTISVLSSTINPECFGLFFLKTKAMFLNKSYSYFFFQFNPLSPLREGDEGYNASPTLQDRIHVLVSVFAGDNQFILTDKIQKKMRDIRKLTSELGRNHDTSLITHWIGHRRAVNPCGLFRNTNVLH